MKRYACYCMTRNIYRMVLPSLKSLLSNNDVEKVFLITEDDEVGFYLPPEKVEIINVSGQKWFKPSSPNYNTKYTYMALMRIALPFILPEYVEKVLSLDLDTIVTHNIEELWDLPMEGKYIAGSVEDYLTEKKGYQYINFGVTILNLKELRDGTALRLIALLNEEEYQYPEQDCVNEEIPDSRKLIFGHEYNYNVFCREEMLIPRIIHFAAYGAEKFKEQVLVCGWGAMPWEKVLEK